MSTESTENEKQGGREVSIIDGVKHVKMACKAGHDWWRKSQRGKPPGWCEEHKPAGPVKVAKAPKASKVTVNVDPSQVRLDIAAKAAKDLAQVSEKSEKPKTQEEYEAEAEARREREKRAAAKRLESIDDAISTAQTTADEACANNLVIMDTEPGSTRQQASYKRALVACQNVRRLRSEKNDLARMAA